jgi:hypothetical protein
LGCAFVACAPPEHPSNPDAIDQICQPLCAKRSGCDPSFEFGPCMNRCRSSKPRRIYYRADYIEASRSCIARTACGPDLGPVIDRACFTDVYAALPRSSMVQGFCSNLRVKDASCGMGTEPVEKCIEGHNMFTAAILEQMNECLRDHPCRTYRGCLHAIVGPDVYADDPDRNTQWRGRPVPKPPPSTIRLNGTTKLAGTIPLPGAKVCIHEHPEIACATSNDDSAFAFDVPANKELALTVDAPGAAKIVVPITTNTKEMTRNIVFDKLESIQEHYRAFGAKYPDEATGFVLVRTEVPGNQDVYQGLEGLEATMLPTSGSGPFYFDANGTPNPARKSTSSWSSVVFANTTSGVAEIGLGPAAITCVPITGWAAQVVNRVRLPVLAGYETHVRMRCNR